MKCKCSLEKIDVHFVTGRVVQIYTQCYHGVHLSYNSRSSHVLNRGEWHKEPLPI